MLVIVTSTTVVLLMVLGSVLYSSLRNKTICKSDRSSVLTSLVLVLPLIVVLASSELMKEMKETPMVTVVQHQQDLLERQIDNLSSDHRN